VGHTDRSYVKRLAAFRDHADDVLHRRWTGTQPWPHPEGTTLTQLLASPQWRPFAMPTATAPPDRASGGLKIVSSRSCIHGGTAGVNGIPLPPATTARAAAILVMEPVGACVRTITAGGRHRG
jgi:hypothetical protein